MESQEYAVMFRVEETHWWYKALHQLIFQILDTEVPRWREKEILDAGCGTGLILKQLGNPVKTKAPVSQAQWGLEARWTFNGGLTTSCFAMRDSTLPAA